MRMQLPSALLVGSVLAVCLSAAYAATSSIDAGTYRKFSCQQLLDESRQVSARAKAIGHESAAGRTDETANAEVAVVIPRILVGPKSASGELAILKEKIAALQDASIQSQCPIEFRGAER